MKFRFTVVAIVLFIVQNGEYKANSKRYLIQIADKNDDGHDYDPEISPDVKPRASPPEEKNQPGKDQPAWKDTQLESGKDQPTWKAPQRESGKDQPKWKAPQRESGKDQPQCKEPQSQSGKCQPQLKEPQPQYGKDQPPLKEAPNKSGLNPPQPVRPPPPPQPGLNASQSVRAPPSLEPVRPPPLSQPGLNPSQPVRPPPPPQPVQPPPPPPPPPQPVNPPPIPPPIFGKNPRIPVVPPPIPPPICCNPPRIPVVPPPIPPPQVPQIPKFPTADPEDIGGCFPGTSMVMLDGGEKRSMEDLRIGDKIMTVKNGNLEPTRVLGFLDKKVNQTAYYTNLILEDNRSLYISSRHVMFIKGDNNTIQSILAKDVSLGDMIIVYDGKKIGYVPIRDITIELKMGLYVPLTHAGTLLVDGVLVSSYTNADHWLAHIALSPLRWWPTLLLDTERSQNMEGLRNFPRLMRNLGSILGLVTLADGKIKTIENHVLEMSQLAMERMDKTEF